MEKKKLINFINKYSLGGLVSAVKVKAKDSKLMTTFATDDKIILGYVMANNIDLPDSELGIFNTNTLSKLLNALDSDITIDLKEKNGKVVSLNLKDKTLAATFMLSDLDVIPTAPEIKQVPPTTFECPINAEFISKFASARNALTEATTFSFVQEGNEVKMIINYDLHNTDRISVDVGIEYEDSLPIIKFDVNKFMAILNANKDCTTGKLLVSDQGLLTVIFTADDIQTKYFMVMLQSN